MIYHASSMELHTEVCLIFQTILYSIFQQGVRMYLLSVAV